MGRKSFTVRKAHIRDAKQLHSLINGFAVKDLMMPRSLDAIYEGIRDFWLAQDEKGAIIGCAALHVVGWHALAEIKSLAVNQKWHKRGVGRYLMESCLREAKELKIGRLFCLTYVPGFFRKFKFKTISKSKLPHKIWMECCDCPKFPDCKEIALIKDLKSK